MRYRVLYRTSGVTLCLLIFSFRDCLLKISFNEDIWYCFLHICRVGFRTQSASWISRLWWAFINIYFENIIYIPQPARINFHIETSIFLYILISWTFVMQPTLQLFKEGSKKAEIVGADVTKLKNLMEQLYKWRPIPSVKRLVELVQDSSFETIPV